MLLMQFFIMLMSHYHADAYFDNVDEDFDNVRVSINNADNTLTMFI